MINVKIGCYGKVGIASLSVSNCAICLLYCKLSIGRNVMYNFRGVSLVHLIDIMKNIIYTHIT
jgi:hypothetical protein